MPLILVGVEAMVTVVVIMRIFADSLATVEEMIIVSVNVLTIPLALATVLLIVTISVANALILVDSLTGVEAMATVSVRVRILAARRVGEGVLIVMVSVSVRITLLATVLVTASAIVIVLIRVLILLDSLVTVEDMATVSVAVLILAARRVGVVAPMVTVEVNGLTAPFILVRAPVAIVIVSAANARCLADSLVTGELMVMVVVIGRILVDRRAGAVVPTVMVSVSGLTAPFIRVMEPVAIVTVSVSDFTMFCNTAILL